MSASETKFVVAELSVRLFGRTESGGIMIGGSATLFSEIDDGTGRADYDSFVKELLQNARRQLDECIVEHGGREMTAEEAFEFTRKEAEINEKRSGVHQETIVYGLPGTKKELN